jgi:hypothetical protein
MIDLMAITELADRRVSRPVRLTAALLVLVGGALHLRLSLDDYGTESIVRTFALNALVSGLVAGYLALRADPVGPILGLAVSAGTLVAFGLSRTGDGVLGFRETGFNPGPDAVLTVIAEVAALAVLGYGLRSARPARPTPELAG